MRKPPKRGPFKLKTNTYSDIRGFQELDGLEKALETELWKFLFLCSLKRFELVKVKSDIKKLKKKVLTDCNFSFE